jgi:hypothetical protein
MGRALVFLFFTLFVLCTLGILSVSVLEFLYGAKRNSMLNTMCAIPFCVMTVKFYDLFQYFPRSRGKA